MYPPPDTLHPPSKDPGYNTVRHRLFPYAQADISHSLPPPVQTHKPASPLYGRPCFSSHPCNRFCRPLRNPLPDTGHKKQATALPVPTPDTRRLPPRNSLPAASSPDTAVPRIFHPLFFPEFPPFPLLKRKAP